MLNLHAVGTERFTPAIFFYFHGADRTAEAAIRRDLSAGGVHLLDLDEPACGSGVICLSEINEDLFSLFRRLHHFHRLVIALASAPAVFQRETTWTKW